MPDPLMDADLQALCERGQQELMRTEYLRAEATLAQAESMALARRDYDTLGRLYMPLQESRRQRRQRCGEGIVCFELVAEGPDDRIDGRHVIENYPQGQLLVAGWGTIEPALKTRQLQAEHELYVETFLGAVYPVAGGGRAVAILPLPEARLPEPVERPLDELEKLLPPHSIVLAQSELPAGSRRGDAGTFSMVMRLWERLHLPFLAAADATADPIRRIEEYRRTIGVDYACELAHQKLSDTARRLPRRGPASAASFV